MLIWYLVDNDESLSMPLHQAESAFGWPAGDSH